MDPKQQMEMLAKLTAPGTPYELGLEEWECGYEKVQGVAFKAGPKTLAEFCDMYMTKHSDKEFLVNGNERYTFGQVDKLSAIVGNTLANKFNIKKGDRVAVSMRNSAEWCVAFLGVTCLGAVVTPLNSLWKSEELRYGLRDSGAKVLICDENILKRVLPIMKEVEGLQVILARSDKAPEGVHLWQDVMVEKPGEARVRYPTVGDDYGTIMYTSGTTGDPKGVVQTHRGICNQLTMAMFGDYLTELMGVPVTKEGLQQCAICPVPLFHATASHHIFLTSLIPGRKVVLMGKWDAGEALKLIEREKPNAWTGVPTMVQDLIEHPDFDKYDTSSLLSVGGGGAPTPKSQVAKTVSKFKGGASNGYGLTETNGAISVIRNDEYVARPTSCGKPFPIAEVVVVDADTGKEIDPSSKEGGELLVKSPLVMSHYWNKEEKTREAIITLPGKGPGWFRTGDIARVDEEGFIYIMDRKKDIIIRGGENISCAEVEGAAFTNDKVHECTVFGIKDDRLGESVGIAVVPKAGVTDLTAAEVVESINSHLANFKVPKVEHVFFKDILPRGATGKILKRAVRDEINEMLANSSTSKL